MCPVFLGLPLRSELSHEVETAEVDEWSKLVLGTFDWAPFKYFDHRKSCSRFWIEWTCQPECAAVTVIQLLVVSGGHKSSGNAKQQASGKGTTSSNVHGGELNARFPPRLGNSELLLLVLLVQ